jgi:hypothetical protein
VQWYGKVPAVVNANENCRPGAIVRESHPAAFDVDVCETVSVFTHVTVSPTATITSPGLNALLPNTSAPLGMVTDDDAPPEGGAGGGIGDGDDRGQ